MLDYLSFVVDTLVKIIPGLKQAKAKSEHAALGAKLIFFYNDANAMLADGYRLISSLRNYVDLMERHLATGNASSALDAGHQMHNQLTRQALALINLQSSFTTLWHQLSPLVDTVSFQQTVLGLAQKTDAIESLLDFMRTGHLPVSREQRSLFFVRWEDGREIEEVSSPGDPGVALLSYRDETNFVATNVPWEANILNVVKEYLEIRRPEQQLEMIAEGLELIRKAILDNFELKDVLLKISDEPSRRGWAGP